MDARMSLLIGKVLKEALANYHGVVVLPEKAANPWQRLKELLGFKFVRYVEAE